jgi:hypothetical protein
LLFLGLLGYFFYLQKHPAARSKNRIFKDLKAGEIQMVQIKHGTEVIELKRKGKRSWLLGKPIFDWASSVQAENLTESLSRLSSEGSVLQKEKMRDYGLSKLSYAVSIRQSSGAILTLLLGDLTPTNQGYYAYIPAQKKLCIVSLFLGKLVEQPLNRWRSKKLFHLKPADVSQIEIQSKGMPLVLKRKKMGWILISPLKAKAETAKVQNLLSEISGFRMKKFSSGTKETLKEKLPQIVLSLWTVGKAKPEYVEIFKKISIGFPAFSSTRNYPYFVTGSLVKDLEKSPRHFVDLHLLGFKESSVEKLEVERGTQDYLFKKTSKGWKIEKPLKTKVRGWKANLIINDLKGLESPLYSGSPPGIFKPAAVIKLWEKSGKRIQLSVGSKTMRKKKSIYPVEISGLRAWAKADLLMKDIP